MPLRQREKIQKMPWGLKITKPQRDGIMVETPHHKTF